MYSSSQGVAVHYNTHTYTVNTTDSTTPTPVTVVVNTTSTLRWCVFKDGHHHKITWYLAGHPQMSPKGVDLGCLGVSMHLLGSRRKKGSKSDLVFGPDPGSDLGVFGSPKMTPIWAILGGVDLGCIDHSGMAIRAIEFAKITSRNSKALHPKGVIWADLGVFGGCQKGPLWPQKGDGGHHPQMGTLAGWVPRLMGDMR